MPTLLIIDDDENLAVVLKRSLRAYDVTVATSAEEGLEHVARKAFDAILCDMHLPKKSGADFHATLVAARPELASRVVFMTGGAGTTAMERFLVEHEDRVIEKPFELERLRRAIARIIARAAPVGIAP